MADDFESAEPYIPTMKKAGLAEVDAAIEDAGRAWAEVALLRQEVARLRAGEADQPAPEGTAPTPAQWIRRWNEATPEQRLDIAKIIQGNAMANYAVAVEIETFAMRARRLHPTPAELVASHAESDTLCTTCISPAPCPTRRALDGED